MNEWYSLSFEALKLGAQFGGALFIARKAVQWALSRYKQEKHWERKLQAYTDLLAAIGTMHQVLDKWENNELERKEVSPEADEENVSRYRTSMQKLEEAIGVAELILPPKIAGLLGKLQTDLRNAQYRATSWMEAIEGEWVVLNKLRKEVLEIGRADLKI
ncbi:hypothetical protein [Agrobacterium tumefaciens]|uniref:Uncharacterized protein n=1 Tax=Agrobacterium tumefaciens TaxID=358 RepID=A0AA44F7P4_AGRTU|nr:hypothetical protein [Agrobacterium tumefaciens]NTB86396.1 hypothetical protein [Agrobacterium tumefaciens]NTC17412.1 hypothetical protein [Agrobacterium tumefaciens]NTC30273.1 hypothetical protein [Agrobacterium tumefaciens]